MSCMLYMIGANKIKMVSIMTSEDWYKVKLVKQMSDVKDTRREGLWGVKSE